MVAWGTRVIRAWGMMGKVGGKNHLQDLDADGMSVKICVLRKYDSKECVGFVRLWIDNMPGKWKRW